MWPFNGGGQGNPLSRYSRLENPMDRGHKESDTTEATQQAHTNGSLKNHFHPNI